MFEDAEVSRPDIERMIDSNEVGVQGVVNDEPASRGSPFRFRGSGERVSLAGMVYPLDQGEVVLRSAANGLGYSQVNATILPRAPFLEDLAVQCPVTCGREQTGFSVPSPTQTKTKTTSSSGSLPLERLLHHWNGF